MENKYFSEVVRLVYKITNAIVFALEVFCNSKVMIRLNPADFIISNIIANKIHVYLIAVNKSMAEQVETLDMTKEQIT